MKFKNIFIAILLLLGGNSYAQQNSIPDQLHNDSVSILDSLVTSSNSYQDYKVIKMNKIASFKKYLQETVSKNEQKYQTKIKALQQTQQQVTDLKSTIKNLESELASVKEEKDSISLLGLPLSKAMYSVILWSIICVLLLLLGLYFYRFKDSNLVRKRSVKDLEELQEEYEDHRKASLEREQKIRRQLQDEINKNRGVQ